MMENDEKTEILLIKKDIGMILTSINEIKDAIRIQNSNMTTYMDMARNAQSTAINTKIEVEALKQADKDHGTRIRQLEDQQLAESSIKSFIVKISTATGAISAIGTFLIARIIS